MPAESANPLRSVSVRVSRSPVFRIGAAAAIAALAMIPLLGRWRERESTIAEKRTRLAEIEWLVAHRENGFDPGGGSDATDKQILSARSVAVAAATLQSIVQRYADENGITLNRLDVAEPPEAPSGSFPMIPCSVAAVGDIYGLTEFLFALKHGRPVVDIREMSIVSSSALGDGVLQISLNIRAPAMVRQ